MKTSEEIKSRIEKIQKRALFIGFGSLIACGVGAFIDKTQFFQSYLFGYLFLIGIPTAGIAIVGLHHLVGGGWGFAIQRILEAAGRTLPLMIVLFLPFAFGMQDLFIWARPDVVAGDVLLQHKAPFLNVAFFWARAAVYFGIWGFFTFQLTRWSYRIDETGDTSLLNSMAKTGGPALLFYVLAATFASFDWAMSLDPYWFSTIFGFYFVIGQALLTLAFAIVVFHKLARFKPLADVVQTQHFHDLGNLLLAFIALWAYISFSQFLIIWSGNLPEELPWYLHRTRGGWQYLAVFVVMFHFVVPFFILLSRRSKRNIETLSKVAYGIIVMRLIDLYWIIKPNFHPEHISVHWLDILAPLALGGLWVAYFLNRLQARPLLPVHDPRVKERFTHEPTR